MKMRGAQLFNALLFFVLLYVLCFWFFPNATLHFTNSVGMSLGVCVRAFREGFHGARWKG